MTKAEIQKILLAAAGNPTVGAVKVASEKQAEALAKAMKPEVKAEKVEKEIRVEESEETR